MLVIVESLRLLDRRPPSFAMLPAITGEKTWVPAEAVAKLVALRNRAREYMGLATE
jgi:hypothetical protein